MNLRYGHIETKDLLLSSLPAFDPASELKMQKNNISYYKLQ